MSKLIDDLFQLQNLLRDANAAAPEHRQQIEKVRGQLPEPVAAHFLRQIANGQKGIAYVRNGVCSACHLRLSHGLVHMLGRTDEPLVCESCGAFVVLAPEAATVPQLSIPRVRRVVKREERAVA